MKHNVVKISSNFRKMAARSVASILLFFVTYIFLIISAIAFTVLCGYCGIALIGFYGSWITGMLGIGLLSLGFLILIFLIKFTFTSTVTDRSHLHLITSVDEQELFKLIYATADKVQTSYPKKVYLSSDVNAAVFYDSNFWSMLLPVKKNLVIGLGLMNTVTATELQAILAHEFGHFSQRSMKVGSFVYNVNKVIYNLLYDNESFKEMMTRWASFSNYFALFVHLAGFMIQGIQWVLNQVYIIVNKNYLALSREMEFHADAIAAEATGSAPLINSLLRMELAESSINTVVNYYHNRISEAYKTLNIYPQQGFMMSFSAQLHQIPLENGLPDVSIDTYKRFKRSRLILKDQWSSHPATEERVAELIILNKVAVVNDTRLANDLLNNKITIEEEFTKQIFEHINYTTEPTIIDTEIFRDNILKQVSEASFPALYNGYYDSRNPLTDLNPDSYEEVTTTELGQISTTAADLFSIQVIDSLFILSTLENDFKILEQISEGSTGITTFDYDGQKYTTPDSHELIRNIRLELESLNLQIRKHEEDIFWFFYSTAKHSGRETDFKQAYTHYKQIQTDNIKKTELSTEIIQATGFIHRQTSIDEIKVSLPRIYQLEKQLKVDLKIILDSAAYQKYLNPPMIEGFKTYIDNDYKYFGAQNIYFEEELKVLFDVIGHYYEIIEKSSVETKREFLVLQADLIAYNPSPKHDNLEVKL